MQLRKGKLKIWSESNPEIVHKIRSENGRKSAGALRKPMKVREDGYKLSPRARKNMSLAKKGKTVSELTKLKISNIKKLLYQQGKSSGWTTRKGRETYAERFWRTVLENNNIEFIREFKVNKKKDLGMDSPGVYFLDFLLPGNVDLEIDGKQHGYADRIASDKIRDEYLTKAGYKVYRIRFINPKNSDEVKNQIDEFLEWYNKNK